MYLPQVKNQQGDILSVFQPFLGMNCGQFFKIVFLFIYSKLIKFLFYFYEIFSQQPLQFVPGIYHNPIDTHPVGSNFGAAPQIRVGSAQMPDNRGGTLPNIPGIPSLAIFRYRLYVILCLHFKAYNTH